MDIMGITKIKSTYCINESISFTINSQNGLFLLQQIKSNGYDLPIRKKYNPINYY